MKKIRTRITLAALMALTFAVAADADVSVTEISSGTTAGATETVTFDETVAIPAGNYDALEAFFVLVITPVGGTKPWSGLPSSGTDISITFVNAVNTVDIGSGCTTTHPAIPCLDSETFGPVPYFLTGPGTLELIGSFKVSKHTSYFLDTTTSLLSAPEAGPIELGGVMLLGLGATFFARRRSVRPL